MKRYKILKRLLAAVSIAAMLAGVVPPAAWADTTDEMVMETAIKGDTQTDELQNGSFESPQITKTYDQPSQTTVPNWCTTAKDGKIELYRENAGTYITGKPLTIPDGKQGAELNAAEASTLYQHISATPGSVLEWGLTHRGRWGTDTMLLCIGPKQTEEPKKEYAGQNESDSTTPKKDNNTDQFMKMGEWLHGQTDVVKIPDNNGGCVEVTVYSRKFDKNGLFVNQQGMWPNYNQDFSFTKTSELTEEWHVWIIKSPNTEWRAYGSNMSKKYDDNKKVKPDSGKYSFEYTVPEGAENLTFAFSAYSTYAFEQKERRGDTIGNLLDDISFKVKYPITIYTSEGGSGSYYEMENGEKKVNGVEVKVDNNETTDIKKYGTDFLYKDTQYTITATPDVKNGYSFTGAYVKKRDGNDIFIPADSFTQSADGTSYTYTYDSETVNETNTVQTTAKEPTVIKLIFALPPWVAYDPNGGEYDGTTKVTYIDREYIGFPFTYDNAQYEAKAATPPKGEAWRFKYWLYKGGKAGSNSVVHYYLPTGDNTSESVQTEINSAVTNTESDNKNEIYTDNAGKDVSSSAEINDEDESISFGDDEEQESFGDQTVSDDLALYEEEVKPTISPEEYTSGYFTVNRGKDFGWDYTGDAPTKYPAAEGLTFIAQWEYRQEAITQVGHDSSWKNSDAGGTVDCVSGYNEKTEVSGNFTLSGYSDAGRYVSYNANAKEGYTFVGWYEKKNDSHSPTGDLELLTTSSTYGYTVENNNPTRTIYARFAWNPVPGTTFVSYVRKNTAVKAPLGTPFAEGSHTKKISADSAGLQKNDALGRRSLGNTLSTGFMFDLSAGGASADLRVDIKIPKSETDSPSYIKSSLGNSIKTSEGKEPERNSSGSEYYDSDKVILADDKADYLGGSVHELTSTITKSVDLPIAITADRTTKITFGIIIDGVYSPGASAVINQGGSRNTFSGLMHESTEAYQTDTNNGYSKYTEENNKWNVGVSTAE